MKATYFEQYENLSDIFKNTYIEKERLKVFKNFYQRNINGVNIWTAWRIFTWKFFAFSPNLLYTDIESYFRH